jgi:histidine triad (HIT) family protein
MDCPFCKIDAGKNRIIRMGKTVFVMFSDPRLVKGHLLVIPKRHLEKISELNGEERREVFETLVEFQEKILARLASGCDMRSNYRPFLNQSSLKVDHLHFHLLPRESEDELYKKSMVFERGVFKELGKEEAEEILELLK